MPVCRTDESPGFPCNVSATCSSPLFPVPVSLFHPDEDVFLQTRTWTWVNGRWDFCCVYQYDNMNVECVYISIYKYMCVCITTRRMRLKIIFFLIRDHVTTTNYTNPKNKSNYTKALPSTSPPEQRKKGTISNSKKRNLRCLGHTFAKQVPIQALTDTLYKLRLPEFFFQPFQSFLWQIYLLHPC